MREFSRLAAVAAVLATVICFDASALAAQWQSNTGPGGAALGATVGGDVERYFRALALGGMIKPIPWASRPFSPNDLAEFLRDAPQSGDPWRAGLNSAIARRATVSVMGVTSANSGFAWGANDGAMWQGRGLNGAVGLAATARLGPVSLVAAPLAFMAQNARVPAYLQPTRGAAAEPLFYNNVDAPLMMGQGAYSRGDGGESTVRIAMAGAVVGISTASIGWGTGEAFPALFGANAGGFAHVFAGTSGRGAHIRYLGRLHGRYILGALEQTRWSPVQGSETYQSAEQPGTRRIGTGLVVSFSPDVLPNLEVGANRFYHSPFLAQPNRWDSWSRPFDVVFKRALPARVGPDGEQNGDLDNQMASFFARIVFPKRGVEASFEIFREDYNWDSRDLAQESENNSAVLASIHAITHRRGDQLSVLSLEYFDGNVRPIAQARGQGALYVHGTLRQGHTQRGQLLGSPIGVGAIAGSRVSWERFTRTGSLRFTGQRWRPRSSFLGTTGDGLYPPPDLPGGGGYPKYADWTLDASVASTRFRQRGVVTMEAGVAWAGLWQLSERRTNLYARTSIGVF